MTVTQQNYASIAATLNRATLQVDLRDGYDLVLEASANYTDWSVFSDPDLADFLSVYFQKLGVYLDTPTPTPTTTPPVTTPPTTTPPTSTGGFVVTASYNASTGQITASTSGANGTVEYQSVGLRGWGNSNTFDVPSWQRNGITFIVQGRTSSGQNGQANVIASGGSTPTVTPPTVTPPTITPPSVTPPSGTPPAGGLTGQTSRGYTDGQHIAWHGNGYAIFARVVGGVLYAVGRELTVGAPFYGQVVTLSRAWLTSSQGASFASAFADKAHQQVENISATLFPLTLAQGASAIQPTGTPTVTPPVGTPPVGTGTPAVGTPPAGTPSIGTPPININLLNPPTTTTPTTTTKKNKWVPYVLGGVGIVVLAVIGYILLKNKE